ncbi:MAG: tetratricopeptide repeat protein [Flavobacteriales bacterium]|nr:tetratricopeptide repeat protein [Flavobacteriales bacterium]
MGRNTHSNRINTIKKGYHCIVFLLAIFQFSVQGSTIEEKRDSLRNELSKVQDDSSKAEILCELSRSYSFVNHDSAIKYIRLSENYYDSTSSMYLHATKLHSLGYIHIGSGRFKEAIEYYNRSTKIWKSLGDSLELGWTYNNIAYVFSLLEDDLKALEYLKISGSILEKLNDSLKTHSVYIFTALTYSYLDQPDSAYLYANKAGEIAEGINDVAIKGRTYSTMGFIHESQDRLEESLEYYLKSYECYKVDKDEFRLIEISCNLGFVYQKMGMYSISQRYFEKTRAMSLKDNLLIYLNEIDAGMEANYVQFRNFKKAFELKKRRIESKDSLLNETKLGEIYKLESKYQSQEKDDKLKLLKESGKVEDIKIWNKNLLILALLVLVMPVLIMYKIFKARIGLTSMKREMELEHEVLQNQMNPHFIFNALNGIQRYYIEGNTQRGDDLLGKFSNLIEGVLNNSRKKYVSLKEEITYLDRYLELEQVRTANKFDYFIRCSDGIDKTKVFIPPLIFQPFAENSIWHGIIPLEEKGRIEITIDKRDERTLECRIIDNGIGISKSKQDKKGNIKHESKGLSITRERLGENGRITYASARGKKNVALGTVVLLIIPYTFRLGRN